MSILTFTEDDSFECAFQGPFGKSFISKLDRYNKLFEDSEISTQEDTNHRRLNKKRKRSPSIDDLNYSSDYEERG